MVDRTSLLSVAEMAEVRDAFQDGMQTLQDWNLAPQVTFTRRGGVTIGPVTCIDIALTKTQPESGTVDAVSSTSRGGELIAFAEQFAVPVQQGDRFLWQGQWCVVTTGPITEHDVTSVKFTLEASN